MNNHDMPAEPPDGDPVDRALKDVRKAEHDLEVAHETEERAQQELKAAEHELEEAIHRETDIIVNSRERKVPGHKVTFEEVVLLAFPASAPPPAGQAYVYSMTYRHAASAPHAGELGPGGEVHVKEGSIFNVSRTVQS
jgi:hypothetical protein